MILRIFLMLCAMFTGALAAINFAEGSHAWGAVMAVCTAINLINFATVEV